MRKELRTILYLVAATQSLYWGGFAAGRGHWSMVVFPVLSAVLGWGVGGGITLKCDEIADGAA